MSKTKTPQGRAGRLLDASGNPTTVVEAPKVEATVPVPQPVRRSNPAHNRLPPSFDLYAREFIRVTAAGTGDSVFVNMSEVLALEVHSETNRCQFIMKTGAILPFNEDPDIILARLGAPSVN